MLATLSPPTDLQCSKVGRTQYDAPKTTISLRGSAPTLCSSKPRTIDAAPETVDIRGIMRLCWVAEEEAAESDLCGYPSRITRQCRGFQRGRLAQTLKVLVRDRNQAVEQREAGSTEGLRG